MSITSHNEDGTLNWDNFLTIMAQAKEGKTLQSRSLRRALRANWGVAHTPGIDTDIWEYRIKPERQSIWVVEYRSHGSLIHDGSSAVHYCYRNEDAARDASCGMGEDYIHAEYVKRKDGNND